MADRDADAFAELFQRFGPRVKGLLARSLPASLADEVAQEVFVRIWRKAHAYDPSRAAASTWIFTIARNARVDALRRTGRASPDPTDPVWVPAGTEAPDAAVARREGLAQLHDVLEDLPAPQREILQRTYLRGETLRQAAEAMQIPLGTAKSRLRLALQRLRSTLTPPPPTQG
ncbi:MAG: sigma-70 family RNA polymerase sigma factor [Myxococcales bacterium]|nr:sigma-70 family RNA polymerase sigma factor [Myxococcales bacterium]